MPKSDAYPHIDAPSRAQLRAWLAEHHTQDTGVWLVRWRKHTGDKHLPWPDLVEELLCWGWIDSQVKKLDQDRSLQLISPRRPGSIWSGINKAHVARALEKGIMQPAGLAKIEAAKADGSWTVLDDVEALVHPPDLIAALDADPVAKGHYETFPDSVVKGILWWIKSAKRPATRAKRISETVRLAAMNVRATTPEAKGR